MLISKAGLDLIKRFEGLRLKAYRCPAGVWTIGYGHTVDVHQGDVITEHQADVMLEVDISQFEQCVEALLEVPVTQGQFDALVSFAFNLGCGALGRSRLLKLLNEGDLEGAANQFPLWRMGGGKVLPGLVARRAAERELFESEVPRAEGS
jgi:lysozyme